MPRARLASGAFVLARVLADLPSRRATGPPRTSDRRTSASAAMLLLLGSVGLMVHAHEAVPELATLAALCGAFAALPRAARQPLPRGAAVRRRARRGFALLDLGRAGGAVRRRGSPRISSARSGARAARCFSSAVARSSRLLLAAQLAACARQARARGLRAGGHRRLAAERRSARPTCATSSSPAAGSRGRRGRSRCGRSGRCAGAGASRGFSCRRSPAC